MLLVDECTNVPVATLPTLRRVNVGCATCALQEWCRVFVSLLFYSSI